MKKLCILLLGCVISNAAIAQEIENQKVISETYQRGTIRHDKAFTNITASNRVETTAKAQYEAGKSVVLLPGFSAKPGSVFKANIAPITANSTAENVVMTLTAFPNPFVESTEIAYFLPTDTKVTLTITNISGQEVATLVKDEQQTKGNHSVKFTAYNLVEGGYQYTLKTDETTLSKRLVKE